MHHRRFSRYHPAQRPKFETWVEQEKRPYCGGGFRHARSCRTREARRHTQWVTFKEQYGAGAHRAAPKVGLDRLLATFATVQPTWVVTRP